LKTFLQLLFAVCILVSPIFAQETSVVFFDGTDFPEDVSYDSWGFTTNPMGLVDNMGYTPGTPAIWWETSNWSWQGIEFSLAAPVDLSAIWSTESVKYKLKAPAGINTLSLYMLDVNGYRTNCNLSQYDPLYDGTWKQYEIPLSSFVPDTSAFDSSQITHFAIEAAVENETIPEEMYFDDIWIGSPEIPVHITIFNGRSLSNGIWFEAWGFESNNFTLAEGEGYVSGTNAILWETSNWSWQGKRFGFDNQDFTYSWPTDTLKIKIKAPAGINDLFLAWKDADGQRATIVLDASVVVWDGEWKLLDIPLAEFEPEDPSFDISRIRSFDIEAAAENMTIPERLLFDDIWTGTPSIDVISPEPPASVTAMEDPSYPYMNFVIWDDVESERGERYNVYASLSPISDLDAEGVFCVATDIEEGTNIASHWIYYPLQEAGISYYYAVDCVDQNGNISTTFTAMETPFSNIGKKRAIISLDAPQNFTADGNLDEWANIVPFSMNPDDNLFTGTIDDSFDYSAFCYVAMDNENLYVAFDVIDDVFSWRESNTLDWWEDESIEFFIGLYNFRNFHSFFYRGDEPDHRILFLPEKLEMHNGTVIENNTANYYFQDIGGFDYVIEAKIPFADLKFDEDADFIPAQGMMIPFEILCADADVPDGYNESRLQLGDNPELNPYHGGPVYWTFAWIGMPDFTSVDEKKPAVVERYALHENFPNPFNPTTTITYAIPENGDVELTIFNSLGQIIHTMEYKGQSVGEYAVDFDGSGLASGIYFYRIRVNHFSQLMKMVYIK